MKDIRELLQDADPLRQEPLTWSERRDSQRNVVLATALAQRDRPRTERRARMRLFIALGFVTIIVLLFAEHLSSPLISNVHAAVRFEVRLAEENPAAGLHTAKVSGTDRSVYLHDEAIVTNGDIAGARIVQADSSSYNVAVEFTPSGADKMRAATARHIGKPMAVLLDGQVIMTAIVREPIADSAVITGHLSKDEAERIAGGITSAR